MDFYDMFPGFHQRSLPDITTRILLHVSYTDDLRNLRLVSRGWRDFFDSEINEDKLMDKQFMHAWTKRPPRKVSSELDLRTRSGSSPTNMNVAGDHVFFVSDTSQTVSIYKNFQYVGCIRGYNTTLYSPDITSSFVAYKDCFIDQENFFFPSERGARLRGYYSKHDNALMQQSQDHSQDRLMVDPVEGSGSPQYFEQEVTLKTSLLGRKMLALKSVDDENLLLVCQEESSIVVINLADETEKVVAVSRLGQISGSSQSLLLGGSPGATVDADYDIVRRCWHDTVDVAADSRGLAILWKKEKFLQLVDHAGGKEVWTTDVDVATDNPAALRLAKSGRLTCLITMDNIGVGTAEVHFYENRGGQLVGRFSTGRRWIDRSAQVVRGSLLWTAVMGGHLRQLDARDGRLGSLMLPICDRCSGASGRCDDHAYLVGVVGDRIVLWGFYRVTCGRSGLLAFDLGYKNPIATTLHEQDSPKFLYVKNSIRGEILCYSMMLDVAIRLDFPQGAEI